MKYATFNYLKDGLELSDEVVAFCSHSGDCEADVRRCMQLPKVKEQLDNMNRESLRKELEEYGAWDDEELDNHEDNKMRILWLAAGDIAEGKFNEDN